VANFAEPDPGIPEVRSCRLQHNSRLPSDCRQARNSRTYNPWTAFLGSAESSDQFQTTNGSGQGGLLLMRRKARKAKALHLRSSGRKAPDATSATG
jgi:hypothetical protein